MLYKKNLFFAVFATLFLASCDLDLSLTTEADSSTTSSTTASTVFWDASQSDIFELSADVTTVNIYAFNIRAPQYITANSLKRREQP